MTGATEPAAEHISALMALLTPKLLMALSVLPHSNCTSSPPLKANAIIALGDIISRASSQPRPASTTSEICSCSSLLEAALECAIAETSLDVAVQGEARGEGERRPLPFLPFLGVDMRW